MFTALSIICAQPITGLSPTYIYGLMIEQGHRSDSPGPHDDSSAIQLRGLCHRVTRQFPQDLGVPECLES